MPRATPAQTFDQIEAAVRKKTFGVFTGIDRKGRPHSTGVLYGVSPPASPFALFILTREHYVKVRNVRMNPETTLVVTFPHRILSWIPASCVTFRGRTDVVPFADTDGRWAFDQRKILRKNVASVSQVDDPVFLKLTPEPKVWCYGLGIGLLEMSKDHVGIDYRVDIPAERGV